MKTDPVEALDVRHGSASEIAEIRAENSISHAQQMMNIAPTKELTEYWCKIWRARIRTRITRNKPNVKVSDGGGL
jgi:hypothetical protein